MQNFYFAIIIGICIYIIQVESKSLENYNDNSIDHFKAQRIPFASPLGNSILESYKRDKRQIPPAIIEFQEAITQAKNECVRDMKMDLSILKKSLMYEENPTEKEKCLMNCMLKKTKLMENSNKISEKTVARLAGAMSEDNPLVVSVAVATANNCNKMIDAVESCEAAHQINKCISEKLKAHKLNLYY